MRRTFAVVGLLVLIGVLGACGSETADPGEDGPAAPGTSDSPPEGTVESDGPGTGDLDDTVAHRPGRPDPTYWTKKRMREASPAPMPMDE